MLLVVVVFGLASWTNIPLGGRSVRARCQPGLCDVSFNPGWQVNQISQTAAPHLPLHHHHNSSLVLQAEQTRLAQSVFLGMSCRPKVLLAAPLFRFTPGVCSLQWWANTCVWRVELSSHNHLLYLCCLCLYHLFLPSLLCLLGSEHWRRKQISTCHLSLSSPASL